MEDGEKNHEIHLSIIRGEENIGSILDMNDQIINLWNPEGKTPAMLAIEHEWQQSLQILIERGANLTCKDSKNGNTVMHIAAWKGNLEAA